MTSDVNPRLLLPRSVRRRQAGGRRGGAQHRGERRTAGRDHRLPQLRLARAAGDHVAVRRVHPRHQRRLPRARHAGRLRQRVVLQRDRGTRGLSDADGRHGRHPRARRRSAAACASPQAGLDIILLGETRDELGGSEWQQMFAPDALAHRRASTSIASELWSSCCSTLHEHRLLRAARTTSRTAASPSRSRSARWTASAATSISADYADDLDAVALLFSESQARAIVACTNEHTRRRARPRQPPASRAADRQDGRPARSSSSATACR